MFSSSLDVNKETGNGIRQERHQLGGEDGIV